jgi:predicted DsbA family dithiol-disulfide isomerase
LQRSLLQWEGEPVTVAYKPFFLDPSIPPEGQDFLSYMRKKGDGRISPELFFEGPRQMGLQAGLVFNFHEIPKAPNTTLAHCLIALTPEARQSEMVEAIYDAFFEHGRDVGDLETLLDIVGALGLDPAVYREDLADPRVCAKVEAEVQTAYQLGITGVPFYVINEKYAFSGAQPPEVMTDILQRIARQISRETTP